ncbi:class I adenylate-forming enzyme family protein [Paraburkholderia sp. 40]|uniref:class I adenylate-forming enzyme family protein n=1 Tax=Paraburkholderia sp. 40 TaxID=2991059 RepID=UPI003D1A44F5
MNLCLTSSVTRAARINPDGWAITGPNKVSWKTFADRVNSVAHALPAFGVRPGDRVALLSLNRPEFLEAQYAIWAAGAVLVPINHRLAEFEIIEILNDAQVSCMMFDEDHAAVVREVVTSVESLKSLIALEESKVLSLAAFNVPVALLALLRRMEPATRGVPTQVSDESTAAIFYTGGTTGRPKGVMLSHKSFAVQALVMANALRFQADSVYLHATPMFHLADFGIGLALTVAAGAHAFLPRFDPGQAIERMAEVGVTEVNLVPTMLATLLDQLTAAQASVLVNIRTVAYGGSSIAAPLLQRLMQAMPRARFQQFYGMTELCGACTTLPPERHVMDGPLAGELQSAGQALPMTEIEVRGVDDVPLESGQPGEIVVRGPQMMQGYWRNIAATEAVLRDGWLYTGDVGSIDRNGFVTIVDRIKDMIVTGGENVYSAEVESVLTSHLGVAACAVIGLPDPKWGERVHAVVVKRPDIELSEDDLDAHCRARIAGYKRPRSYEIRDEHLPVSGAGKVRKAQLREEALTKSF